MSTYIKTSINPSEEFNPIDSLYRKYYCPQMFELNGNRKDQKSFEAETLNWVKNAIAEGESFLRTQRGFEGVESALDVLIKVGKASNLAPETLSEVYINEIKRNVWENSAILSNVKPSWNYDANSSKEQTWKKQANILNNLSTDWYDYNFVSDSIKGMTQWSMTTGTGYIELDFDVDTGQRGGELVPFVRGWADCLPVGVGGDLNLQRAYACIIRKEMDIREVWRKWPSKAFKVKPSKSEPTFARKVASAITGSTSIYDLFSDARRKNSSSPIVEVYYVYVDDFSINPTNEAIPMGESSWKYSVPVKGERFQTGFKSNGDIDFKIAEYQDCKLYPNKRLIICTRECILYDGPSRYWHGQYPIVQYCPDKWVWSFLGYSLVAQVVSLNDSLTQMFRMMEDSLKLQLNPPSMIDEQTPPNLAKKSFRVPGMKIRGRTQMGDFIKPIVRDYKPSGEHLEYLKMVSETIARHLGTPDLKSLQQARQVPSGDSIEKYFAQAGAIVTDMSRSMDKPLYELADMNRYNFMQFYSMKRRLQLLGREGLTDEDLDFDPMNMIPASLPNEPSSQVASNGNSAYSSNRMQRAKIHVMNFSTTIERTSAHELTSMQNKLMKFQVSKINPSNGIISPETLAKEAGIKNWGTLPGNTEIEKIRSYLDMQVGQQLSQMLKEGAVQIMIQKAAQAELQQQSPEGQAAGALQQLVAKANQSDSNTELGAAPVGRPSSFTSAPQLKQADAGGRTTITTSPQGES